MPSIPQSLLWISLVVLWLFVLVPMLISKREAVRRTSDVALATRVLNTGRGSRLLRRTGPAAGHRSDPDWQPPEDDYDRDDDEDRASIRPVVVAAADVNPEPDYLDVDVVEMDSGALPVGEFEVEDTQDATVTAPGPEPTVAEQAPTPDPDDIEPAAGDAASVDAVESDAVESDAVESDGTGDEYEYVADSSGLEAPTEADPRFADSMSAARRRRHESSTAAAVSARKYQFRRRTLLVLAALLLMSGLGAFLVTPGLWWLCGSVGAVTALYLAYLRRQTRIEEQLRRRRARRMMRSRLGVESTEDQDLDVVPSRLRQPGSVVLEIDDEDPIFENLDEVPFAREFDLPRAAG